MSTKPSTGGFGCDVDLALVHQIDDLPARVCACSETQERYGLAVPARLVDKVLRIYNEDFALPDVYDGACARRIEAFVSEHELRLGITPVLLDETSVQPLFGWDAGDGKTMESATFQHSYSKPGKYAVRLRISGGSKVPACLAAEKEIAVTVLPPPELRILHEPEQIFSGGARDEVLFYTDLPADQDSWICHWDFGDGSRAEGEAVSHIFQKPGAYTVTLTLTDGSGIARKPYSFSKKITVRVHGN